MSGEGQLGTNASFAISGAGGTRTVSGVHTTVAATDTIVTGLSVVTSAVASLESAPVLTCDRATAVIGDQAGTPAAGSILIKSWMPTASGNATPVAATTFSKLVSWQASGR